MTEPKRIKAIDLCSGAGGWACAARGLPIDIVLAIDFWDRACKTYQLNHPATEVICGDLRDKNIQNRIGALRGNIDLVLGGIPCEWLSVYRVFKRTRVSERERTDQRKTLRSVLRLVKKVDPRWYCLEDVKGLKDELPPRTKWHEINARDYSPQRRKRIYVGRFPIPTAGTNTETMGTRLRLGPFRVGPRLFGRRPETAHTFTNEVFLAAIPSEKSPTICDICSRRDAEMAIVDPSLPGKARQIEWQESASLQGFPSDYLFYGSPGDVTKMIGRAVQIETGRAILQAIVQEAGLQ